MKKNIIIIVLLLMLFSTFIYIVLNKDTNKNGELANKEVKEKTKILSYIEMKDSIPYITVSGFDATNEKIKDFYNSNSNSTYSYHYYKDILIIHISSSISNGYEGAVNNQVFYLDLKEKKELSAIDVYDMFAIATFDTVCKQNVDDIICEIDGIKDSLIVIPVGNFLYIESMEMGLFNPFYVSMK